MISKSLHSDLIAFFIIHSVLGARLIQSQPDAFEEELTKDQIGEQAACTGLIA